MPLPHLADRPFITDGGMETTLIFHGGPDLPHFRRSSSSTATGARQLPSLSVVGGCCGTDDRHIREICRVWGSASAG